MVNEFDPKPSPEVRPPRAEAHPEQGIVAGVVLGGRYRIDEQLGRGAIAEVYRGFDTSLAVR